MAVGGQPHKSGRLDGFLPLSRRTLLAALALVGVAGARRGDDSLASIASRAGVRFGSAIRAGSLADPVLAALAAGECATLTPELEMKWAALAPAAGRFDTGPADALATFARARGQRLRGHALLWRDSTPGWFAADPQWPAVERHIADTVAHWRDIVDEWDVVNEPIDADGLRRDLLLDRFGPAYVARALHAARAAAPKARLMLNEYDLEYDLPDQAARRAALLALVRALRAQGAPLDGIGVQAHLDVARPFAPAAFREFLAALADEGMAIGITELDVKERDLILPAASRDGAVADHVARFLDVALAQPAVGSLTSWGLSDRQSWLKVTAGDTARFPGAWADGSSPGLNRGLPYDSDAHAKPMRAAMIAALRARGSANLYRRPPASAHGQGSESAIGAARDGGRLGDGAGAGARG